MTGFRGVQEHLKIEKLVGQEVKGVGCYERRRSISLTESAAGREKVGLRNKPMDLCTCESEDHEHVVGPGVNIHFFCC